MTEPSPWKLKGQACRVKILANTEREQPASHINGIICEALRVSQILSLPRTAQSSNNTPPIKVSWMPKKPHASV
jgi:hypothetical protein